MKFILKKETILSINYLKITRHLHSFNDTRAFMRKKTDMVCLLGTIFYKIKIKFVLIDEHHIEGFLICFIEILKK